jgi:fatty-acyl-CoA synthase
MTDYSSTDDGLRWWALHDPDKRMIVCGPDTVTYGQADAWVDRAAHYLASTSIQIGDRVGFIGSNTIEWCIAAFAAFRVGAVVAPISERSVAHEVLALIGVTDTRLVMFGETHRDMMAAVAGQRPDLIVRSLDDVMALRAGEPARFDRPDVDNDLVAAVIYSSGSTGMPKGIALTMRALIDLVEEWMLTDPCMGREMRTLATTSLAPMGGFVDKVMRASVVGGTVFLMPKFDERAALELLVNERINSLLTVPLIFQRISALPEFASADLSALANAGVGGAPVPIDELKKWHLKGVPLRQIYGSTESGSQFAAMPVAEAFKRLYQVGRGNMFRQVKVVRPDGTQCEPDEDGEILVRGPSLMVGYWGNQEATDAVLRDGWLHTGDLGRMDKDGYFSVIDRIKEVIISGGYNIGPTEVETALLALDGIAEAAVIPVPDQTYGEGVGALVRLTAPLTIEQIVSHCRSRLSGYKVPRYLLVIDEALPRGEQGKYSKMTMRKKYGPALKDSPVR